MYQCVNMKMRKILVRIRHCEPACLADRQGAEATNQSVQGNRQIAALRPPGGGLARNDGYFSFSLLAQRKRNKPACILWLKQIFSHKFFL